METLEVVFGLSFYTLLKESIENSNVLMIDALFNVGDLNNISNYEISIPKKLVFNIERCSFKDEVHVIIDNIKKNNIIRVWAGHDDIYSSLLLLYVSSIVNQYNGDLHVLYSDLYDKGCISPNTLNKDEVKELIKFNYKLNREEIVHNTSIWKQIVKENAQMRIIENRIIQSVGYDYYDTYILDGLKKLGKVSIGRLIGYLMQEVYLDDTLYVFFINRLIDKHKIRIYRDEKKRYFKNLIEVNY